MSSWFLQSFWPLEYSVRLYTKYQLHKSETIPFALILLTKGETVLEVDNYNNIESQKIVIQVKNK